MKPPADIAWSRSLRGRPVAQTALWTFAAFFALSAHAAGAWWTLRERAPSALQEASASAVMIDLSPVAMAPESPEEQIAMDTVDSMESPAVETPEALEPDEVLEPVEAAVPEEIVAEPVEEVESALAEPVQPDEPLPEPEPEPVEEAEIVEPDTAQEEIDPVDEMIAARLDEVSVPLPAPRPAPPPARPEPPRQQQAEQPRPREQARPRPSAPSQQATRAQAQAAPGPAVAAPQSSRGSAGSVSPARWQSRLMSHLERRKRYPATARRQRQQGTAQVRFSIDANGNVQSVSLARSSGVPVLDEEVIALVRRASPVPAPPPGVNRTIVVPVQFSLR